MAILTVLKAIPWLKIAKGTLIVAEIAVGVLSPIVAGSEVKELLKTGSKVAEKL